MHEFLTNPSLTDLHWCWSWPLHLLSWPLHHALWPSHLRLWCYPFINQHKYSTCTNGSGHWLQLVLVAFFLQPFAQALVAPVVVPPVATNLHWWSFSFHPLAHILHMHSSNLHCVVVANLHCMVVVCGGGQLALYGGDLWWWWYLYVEVCIYMKIALQPE